MRFHHREILEEVAALTVPEPDKIVINHGSAMVVRGIRSEHEGGDIDIVTNLRNVQFLEQTVGFVAVRKLVGVSAEGKEQTLTVRHDNNKRFDVHRWDFSPLLYARTGKGRISLERSIANSDQDDETGIWVARPELILLTKEATGRPKDAEDARRLKQYIDLGY